MELDVIRCARIPIPYDYVYRPPGRGAARWITGFRAGRDALDCPCLAFVVRHPTAGAVLVDTGLHPAAHRSRADFGPLMRVIFRQLEPVGPSFDRQLLGAGLDPVDVEHVVMTHLHVDHTSGMRLLPNARFVCSKQEWAAATAPLGVLKGYVSAHLPHPGRMTLVDVERHGTARGPFARTLDLFDDGSFRLISTSGHSAGHLSVLLRTTAGEILLVGDAAYTTRSIHEQRLPLLTDDDSAARRTLLQLRDYTQQNPAALVIPTHDPTAWRAIERPS